MDSRNNEGILIAMVLGVVIFIIQVVAAVIVTIAIFITAFLSTVALFALLRGGLTIDGEDISVDDARMFFVRGFIGAAALPLFIAAVFAILGSKIPLSLECLMLAGYAFGSAGIEILAAMEQAEKAKTAEMTVLPPPSDYDYHVPPVTPTIQPPREPFRFASWEDEENG